MVAPAATAVREKLERTALQALLARTVVLAAWLVMVALAARAVLLLRAAPMAVVVRVARLETAVTVVRVETVVLVPLAATGAAAQQPVWLVRVVRQAARVVTPGPRAAQVVVATVGMVVSVVMV